MSSVVPPRRFKDGLYAQLARIGKAVSSAARVETLELLAQSERTVESLAEEMGLSTANASHHLQVLRQAGLVASRRQGLHVHYRLADPSVFELSRTVRVVAEQRLAELERHVREHFGDRDETEAVGMDALLERVRAGEVVVLDTRPTREFEAGHIEGAISIPIDELQHRLAELPKRKEIVAYCRGPYCVYADRAVEALRASGRRARRMKDGFPEWRAAGLPVRSAPRGA
jgi:rhodanese-related sulfurtransferase/DNA-binding transcriptional ArsR family regulator